MSKFLASRLHKCFRHCFTPAMHRRPYSGLASSGRERKALQAGVTLLELSFVIVVALAIIAFALMVTDSWKVLLGLSPEDHVARQVKPKAAVLQAALRDWFVTTRCSNQAPGPPPWPLGTGSGNKVRAADQDMKDYAVDGAWYLDDTKTFGTFTGCVSRATVQGVPRAELYWEPPGHIEVSASLARRLQAQPTQCPTTAGSCPLSPSTSCLLWDEQLALEEYGGQVGHMLEQWLERFGIDCDQNDDGTIDLTTDTLTAKCDSDDNGSLGPNAPEDSDGNPYEYEASGYEYLCDAGVCSISSHTDETSCTNAGGTWTLVDRKCLRDLDINATSNTDFDALDFNSSDGTPTDDYDVDAEDYAYWGC